MFCLFNSQLGRTANVYTLKKAADYAIQNNADILLAREKIREGEEKVSTALSSIYPRLDLSFNAYAKQDALAGNANVMFNGDLYNFYQGALIVTQPLYAGGAIAATWQGLQKDKAIQETQLKLVQRDVQLAVIKSFYGLLFEQHKVESAIKSEKIQQTLLATATRRFKNGAEQEFTVLQIKTALALLAPKISEAKNNVRIKAKEFSNVLGMQDAEAIEIVGSLGDDLDWEYFKVQNKQEVVERPELIEFSLKKERSKDTREATLAKHYPRLDLVGVWARSANRKSDLLDGDRGNFYGGVELSVPLFSGLSSFRERSMLSSQEAQLSIEERKLRDSFRLNRVQVSENLSSTHSMMDANRKALKQAEEALDVATRTYRLGTSTYVQVSEAQKNLTDAELAMDQARFNKVIQMAEYSVAFGWPLENFIAMIESSVKKEGSPQ